MGVVPKWLNVIKTVASVVRQRDAIISHLTSSSAKIETPHLESCVIHDGKTACEEPVIKSLFRPAVVVLLVLTVTLPAAADKRQVVI